MDKTNAMRMLDQKKIKYNVYEYPHTEGDAVDGENVAKLLGEDPKYVFKTLVCVDNTKHYRVCVVNVCDEIDFPLTQSGTNLTVFRPSAGELLQLVDNPTSRLVNTATGTIASEDGKRSGNNTQKTMALFVINKIIYRYLRIRDSVSPSLISM